MPIIEACELPEQVEQTLETLEPRNMPVLQGLQRDSPTDEPARWLGSSPIGQSTVSHLLWSALTTIGHTHCWQALLPGLLEKVLPRQVAHAVTPCTSLYRPAKNNDESHDSQTLENYWIC